jgi:5-oxoprolinase (ATP-hydrolysing) subunit A
VPQKGAAHSGALLFCTIPRAAASAAIMRIDLNADVGESFGAYSIGQDAALMRSITSANVAAGFHAGDPSVLRSTIRSAREHHVALGAHPGYPDLAGFGRRAMALAPREAEDLVLYQVAAVAGVAAAEGTALRHVKPHGALYNSAATDPVLAAAIVRAVTAFDRRLILVGPPRSALLHAGVAAGLRVAAEGFADRAYEADGSLVSRTKPGAVVHDISAIVTRAVRMATERTVTAVDGSTLAIDIDTICVHGDTPGADQIAALLRVALEAAGVSVRPLEP